MYIHTGICLYMNIHVYMYMYIYMYIKVYIHTNECVPCIYSVYNMYMYIHKVILIDRVVHNNIDRTGPVRATCTSLGIENVVYPDTKTMFSTCSCCRFLM